jgi:ATP-dependent DNA helicase RecQ
MSFERKNLAYIVRQTKDKLAETMKILNAVDGTAIIYTHNREKTKEYAEALASIGTTATFYHAGLDPVTRSDRQALWQEDKVKVMVATNAFGMGIDKPDVRVVIHVDCPDSIEEYFQEAGRAGRDGKKSYAVLLRGLHENITLDKRIANNFPEKDYIKKVYEHVAYFLQVGVGSGYGYTFEFDMDKFCKYFKHFPLNVKPALSILQMAGYIEYSEEEVSFTRMQFLVDRDDLYRLKDMTENENDLVTTILRCYSGLFADLTRISEKLLSQKTGIEESQIYLILKGLSKRNIIRFIPKKNIPHIKYLQNRVVSEEIIIPKNVYEQRRKLFEMRINAMKYYIGNDKFCRNKTLLRYFGETKNEDCGHCDVCIRNNRNDKEQETTYCNIRNEIIDCLKDGKGHKVDEMRNIDPNYVELNHTLMKMLNDEEIINNDGSYFLNIKL